jgi:hypothetical protein
MASCVWFLGKNNFKRLFSRTEYGEIWNIDIEGVEGAKTAKQAISNLCQSVAVVSALMMNFAFVALLTPPNYDEKASVAAMLCTQYTSATFNLPWHVCLLQVWGADPVRSAGARKAWIIFTILAIASSSLSMYFAVIVAGWVSASTSLQAPVPGPAAASCTHVYVARRLLLNNQSAV